MSLNEADTCRKYVTPQIQSAGWEELPCSIKEQHVFTDGRVEFKGTSVKRGETKRADYILRYTRDFPIAVVEAKPEDAPAGEGMQQAKEYAVILGLKFAYSTNGQEILEFDFITGEEKIVSRYPSPQELYSRLQASIGLSDKQSATLLTPYHHVSGYTPRYYQQIAINRIVQNVLLGNPRTLIT